MLHIPIHPFFLFFCYLFIIITQLHLCVLMTIKAITKYFHILFSDILPIATQSFSIYSLFILGE
ncbi:hypothetical protein BY458DRAFT_526314 [Sporodiniella umbellata]|nr:hypothetical protein BY458DRAFT_526314 [Sporodiniella umbellata]